MRGFSFRADTERLRRRTNEHALFSRTGTLVRLGKSSATAPMLAIDQKFWIDVVYGGKLFDSTGHVGERLSRMPLRRERCCYN